MDGQAFGSLKQPSTYKSEGFEKKSHISTQYTWPRETRQQWGYKVINV